MLQRIKILVFLELVVFTFNTNGYYDEENNYYRYDAQDAINTEPYPLLRSQSKGRRISRTGSSGVRDALRQIQPNYDLDNSMSTFTADTETDNDASDLLSKILKNINAEKLSNSHQTLEHIPKVGQTNKLKRQTHSKRVLSSQTYEYFDERNSVEVFYDTESEAAAQDSNRDYGTGVKRVSKSINGYPTRSKTTKTTHSKTATESTKSVRLKDSPTRVQIFKIDRNEEEYSHRTEITTNQYIEKYLNLTKQNFKFPTRSAIKSNTNEVDMITDGGDQLSKITKLYHRKGGNLMTEINPHQIGSVPKSLRVNKVTLKKKENYTTPAKYQALTLGRTETSEEIHPCTVAYVKGNVTAKPLSTNPVFATRNKLKVATFPTIFEKYVFRQQWKLLNTTNNINKSWRADENTSLIVAPLNYPETYFSSPNYYEGASLIPMLDTLFTETESVFDDNRLLAVTQKLQGVNDRTNDNKNGADETSFSSIGEFPYNTDNETFISEFEFATHSLNSESTIVATNIPIDDIEIGRTSTVDSKHGEAAGFFDSLRNAGDLRKSGKDVFDQPNAGNIDIPMLLQHMADLSKTYRGAQLFAKVEEKISKEGLPTKDPLDAVKTTTDMYSNLTGTIMGKCFVCGLDMPGIPKERFCGDAFAVDFIPLAPLDPQARGHIFKYRKYCRWKNIPRFTMNDSDSRSIWGRWTGGCSVRWVDLSGIYTERACRNRHRASQGISFASKRLAKLEMALQHLENGCIMSPVSTLLPLSRGISLYARFHACVCTGNWCNRATLVTHWSPHVAFFAMLGFMLEHFVGAG